MIKKQELQQLKDYDVLGAGSVRREQVLALSHSVELLTYRELIPTSQAALYDALLKETVDWLKPVSVRAMTLPQKADDFLLEVLLEDLRKEFPQTTDYVKGGLRELLKDYLREAPWQGPLLSAHFRYFPVFLKRRFQVAQLYLIAQKEWIESYLKFADFGFPPPETGRVLVNPSLQSLYTADEVAEVQLSAGLTTFYFNYVLKKVCEHKMDVWEAALVDVLQEDRKYTADQVLDQVLMMDLESPLSRLEWASKLSSLQSHGIILVSGSTWILNAKK
jgi:hypothetical protein